MASVFFGPQLARCCYKGECSSWRRVTRQDKKIERIVHNDKEGLQRACEEVEVGLLQLEFCTCLVPLTEACSVLVLSFDRGACGACD